jgi:hypothetical protein
VSQHSADTEIGNLDFSSLVDQQIGGLYITMNNFVLVQVKQALQHLPGNLSQIVFWDFLVGLKNLRKGSTVHVLQHKRDLSSSIEYAITLHDVWRIRPSENLHFPHYLLSDSKLVLFLNDFEGINFSSLHMLNLVDLTTAPTPQS